MPADSPSLPVRTRSTDRFPESTCGLTMPVTSGAPPVSHVTEEMTSGLFSTNSSIMGSVSFWLPATSRMCSSTGSDGVSGTSAAAVAAGASPPLSAGGAQAPAARPRAVTPTTTAAPR